MPASRPLRTLVVMPPLHPAGHAALAEVSRRSLLWACLVCCLAIPLSGSEEAPLRVVHTTAYAPFEFADDAGRPQGYLIDLFRLWSHITGREVRFIAMPWSECKQAVLDGRADVITGMTPTDQRLGTYAFGREVARAESRIFTHRSLPVVDEPVDLAGLLVGVVDGDQSHDFLERDVPTVQILSYPDYRSLCRAAVAGEVRIVAGTSATIFHHLTSLGQLGSFAVGRGVINSQALAPAVAADRLDLVAALDAGLQRIPDEDWERLARHWVPHSLDPQAVVDWAVLLRWLAIGGGALLLLGTGVVLWSVQLRRRVRRAVAERDRAHERERELERRLRHSQKLDALGQLAGGVAHDFNNLLSGIMGYAEQLAEDPDAPPAQRRRSAERIIDVAERAARLNRQLLTFAHNSDIDLRPCDLHAVVVDAVALLDRALDPRIELVQDLAAEEHTVLGDVALLENCLLNLCINARDAMPGGGRITIATRTVTIDAADTADAADAADAAEHDGGLEPGRYCLLSVADTGDGIEPAHRERIFEPFFTTKPLGKGTGLGLSAVHGLVRDHGGTITVDSQAGLGSTFSIHLPLSNEQQQGSTRLHRGRNAMAGRGVLVIDDDDMVRAIAVRMLEKAGYRVFEAADGHSGAERYRQHREDIHLVLLDMLMPGIGGPETLRALQAIDASVQVLICTGFGGEEALAGMRRSGIAGVLHKPYRARELRSRVAAILAGDPQLG